MEVIIDVLQWFIGLGSTVFLPLTPSNLICWFTTFCTLFSNWCRAFSCNDGTSAILDFWKAKPPPVTSVANAKQVIKCFMEKLFSNKRFVIGCKIIHLIHISKHFDNKIHTSSSHFKISLYFYLLITKYMQLFKSIFLKTATHIRHKVTNNP